jgi:hypothetical protein
MQDRLFGQTRNIDRLQWSKLGYAGCLIVEVRCESQATYQTIPE